MEPYQTNFPKLAEETTLSYFKHLPTLLNNIVEETKTYTLINTNISTSTFNICYLHDNITDIDSIINKYNGNNFAIWFLKTSEMSITESLLQDKGFIKESNEDIMILNLNAYTNNEIQLDLKIMQVNDIQYLNDYVSVLEIYDYKVREFYSKLSNEDIKLSSVKFFIGYVGDEPVAIGLTFLNEKCSGIFGIMTKEEYRCRGFGTAMMKYIIMFLKANNVSYVTLSASSDSGMRIYKNLGFEIIGNFNCFEYYSKNLLLN
jgi:ribosomal protein S18 acetylase RimI-like enzyme